MMAPFCHFPFMVCYSELDLSVGDLEAGWTSIVPSFYHFTGPAGVLWVIPRVALPCLPKEV